MVWPRISHPRASIMGLLLLALGSSCKRDDRPSGPRSVEGVAPESSRRAEASASSLSKDWRRVRASTVSPQLIEIVDGVAVLRLDVSGFEQLSADERRLAYWLSQAAIRADEISYDQRGPDNLAVKELVEQLLAHASLLPAADLPALQRFAKRVWINKGVHDAWNGQKRPPRLPAERLERLLLSALDAGVKLPRFGVTDRAALKLRWPAIQRALYDLAVDPHQIDRSPPEGEDVLSASATTFYAGVRLRDLEGFKARYPQSSRLVKRGGRLAELVYRTGGEGLAPGLYAEQLARVRGALQMAMTVAGESQRSALGALDEFLRTGEPAQLEQYHRAWTPDDEAIDLVFAFDDVLRDPRGEKGELRALVLLRDDASAPILRALADNAAYFEARLPWTDTYRRTEFGPLLARGAQVMVAAGSAALQVPVGLQVPADTQPSPVVGAKAFWLRGVVDLRAGFGHDALVREFTYDPADLADAERCTGPMWAAHVALREVVGPRAGKRNVESWRSALREYGSAVEEARLDLIALHLVADPKVIEIGLVPDERCAEIHATSYAQALAFALAAAGDGEELVDDRLRAHALVIQYARERGVVEAVHSQGKVFLVVSDLPRWRSAIETLLAELMRIEGSGDFSAAKQLVQKYGSRSVKEWREDAAKRLASLGLPSRQVYLAPCLAPVRNEAGQVIDARLVEGLGLEETALFNAGLRTLE